LEIAKIEM